jgi:hypothetical protein
MTFFFGCGANDLRRGGADEVSRVPIMCGFRRAFSAALSAALSATAFGSL